MIDRRAFLVHGGLASLAMGFAPRIAFARADTDNRFIFILQRGAADGLGTVAPIADPSFAGHRGDLAIDFGDAPKLDGMFALHPGMTNALELYKQQQALFVHAVASPYRDRSHFDGQNVLETGGNRPYEVRNGWMNRMLGLVPSDNAKAMALASTVPLVLRGPHNVASYAPSSLPEASDDMLQRVSMLYQGDAQLHALWSEALSTRQLTGDLTAQNGKNATAMGTLAANLLAPAGGARVMMIETGGWDTHTQQRNRLSGNLKGLDALIGALKVGLGQAWSNTTVLVATEFGRTVAVNGTRGTDHGTGAVAMLFGGGIKGGRVLADWPGLATANLYEGRDLRPTTQLDALIASAVAGTFGIEISRVSAELFPNNTKANMVSGLFKA